MWVHIPHDIRQREEKKKTDQQQQQIIIDVVLRIYEKAKAKEKKSI